MKIKSISKYVLGVMFILGISMNSYAVLPVADGPNLAQNILTNMTEMYNWAEEKAMKQIESQLTTMLAGESMDANNKATARMIVSLNKASQDIQNLEAIQRFSPAPTACGTVSLGATLEDIYCESEKSKEDVRDKSTKKEATFDKTPVQQSLARAKAAEEVVIDCRPDEDGRSTCLEVNLLLGGAPGDATNKELAEISKGTARQIELISGALPVLKTDPMVGDTPTGNAMRVLDYRRVAFKSMVSESLLNVRESFNREDESSGSEMEVLWDFVDSRWGDGDSEFIKLITNTHPKKAQGAAFITTPTQVLREIGVMQAFQTYMTVLQYEQSLREESLHAAMLALEIEPLDR